ncbi:protein kinase [Streptomyces sp. NPDC051018]|uniref:protein kinase domain-containing protein n=1 Tax=Streptomyces sp. NPDC051018 TaxID=3365639 RepID=UPI0037ABE6F6
MSQDGAQGRHAGGSVAGGRYQLRDLLGEGGMASVYLAYDSALDRQVAIKTLHSELGREQSFRERFRREAQAVAKLSHSNIVSVFDTGEDTLDGSLMPYIVMEYVEGAPLGSVLHEDVRRYGAMPADKALRVTADVLAALETSHEMGLVHRDIKPGNVMITKRGVVKVMDFGIARAMQSGVTSMTQTGMVVGTPQYLAPEQALGRGVDARSDLYSVGIMLFQLLTGRLPFDADSPLAIAYAHVQEEPVAPSTINRSITPAMDALIVRALKKNPNERFPSAAAMRDECLRIAAAGGTAAPAILPGAPVASGSGVGSAVFPPVDQSALHAPAPGVQTPYQPGPYGTPTPPPAVGQPTPQYGYPPVAGQHSPAGYQGPTVAPAPYAISPQQTGRNGGGGGGGRGKHVLLIAVSSVLGLLVVAGLVKALTDGDSGDDAGGGGSSPSPSASEAVIPPDRTRTIESTKCSDALEDGSDPSKVYAPDLRYRDVLSVKECLRSAGWTWKITEVDNPQYPKDAVVGQFPSQGQGVLPKNQEFELEISTGKSG